MRPADQRGPGLRAHGAILLALVLGGCATPAPTTPAGTLPASAAVAHSAFESASRLAPASIVGSEESSALLDNFTAYLVALDDRALPGGRDGWAEPIMLPAGAHRLVVGFVRGVFTATATLEFTAEAGAAYEIQQRSDAQIFGKTSSCEFWVVNKNTGGKITGVVKVPLIRSAP